jgi:uncharacterized protein YrrD
MTQRATQLIGKAVVSADNGEKLGTVSDLLLDQQGQLVGLVVRQGLLKTEQVLPSDAVQTLGRDAVVSRSGADLISAREWRERHGAGTHAESTSGTGD